MNTANFIQTYAFDLNSRELYQAAGRTVPQDLAMRIQHTEQLAQQRLSPAQLADAQGYVRDARIRDSEQRMAAIQGREAALQQAQLSRSIPNLTYDLGADGKPISGEQYQQAVKDGKFTVQNKPKEMLKAFKQAREGMVAKYGRSWESLEADMDEVGMIRDKQDFAAAAERLKIDVEDARVWAEKGMKVSMLERAHKGAEKEADSEEIPWTEDQQRKADIVESTLDHDVEPGGPLTSQFQEDLQEDSRHGDLARAWQQDENETLEEAIA